MQNAFFCDKILKNIYIKERNVTMSIVLASKSPRRKELLGLLDLDFKVITADIDETINPSLPVNDEIARLSFEKASAVSKIAEKNSVIISADTVVVFNERVMGKPKDAADAEDMLCNLSGNTHSVITAVTVMNGDKVLTKTVNTSVTFRKLSAGEIRDYIATGEPFDKAGGYGIQGRASKFVSRIDGDYFSVVGLPVCTLSEMLKNFNID